MVTLYDMHIRSLLVVLAGGAVLAGCADPALDVAASDDSGTQTEAAEEGTPDTGNANETDAGPDAAETDAGAVETGDDAGPEADAPTGVGLPCTNMAECTPYGLVCISHDDPTCTTGHCLKRYTCEPHPASDKCTSTVDCVDIHCVSVTDCPVGSNFCVGEMATDSDAPLVSPYGNALGLRTSKCSSGTPAAEPSTPEFIDVVHLYICKSDGDCIMDDGTTGTCCRTSVGISYCAKSCSLK